MASTPKIPGVTFDQMLMFNAHAKSTHEIWKKKSNPLKSLAGSTREKKRNNRERLQSNPPKQPKHIGKKLQKAHKTRRYESPRVPTWCRMLTITQRNKDFANQTAQHDSHRTNHTCQNSVQRFDLPRQIRKTMSTFKANMPLFVRPPLTRQHDWSRFTQQQQPIQSRGTVQIKVLRYPSLPIANEESELPTKKCIPLCHSYMCRINDDIDNICPRCTSLI